MAKWKQRYKKKVAFCSATNENEEGVYLQTFVLGPAWVPLQALKASTVRTLMIGALTTHVRGLAPSMLAFLPLLLQLQALASTTVPASSRGFRSHSRSSFKMWLSLPLQLQALALLLLQLQVLALFLFHIQAHWLCSRFHSHDSRVLAMV